MEVQSLVHDITGKGQPVVLMPGGLSGWLSWIQMAERLSTERTVVRVQLRGLEWAGSGQPILETYTTATETESLLATVDALGLDRFDLAGWSLGGHVALTFALEHPDRVRTLTLIEPAAVWILRESGYPASALAALERDDRSLAGRTITVEDFKRFLVRAGLGQPGDDFESHPSWPTWMKNRQILAHIAMLWDYENSLQRLHELHIPILAVHGMESTAADIAIVKGLVATAPNVTLLELPGDHACHLQNPDRFLEALTEHFEKAA